MFHYLTVERREDGLHVTSLELKKDLTAFDEGLQLKIKTPATIQAVAAK
jgi:hypothetical protein